jgi:hypothetical protein
MKYVAKKINKNGSHVPRMLESSAQIFAKNGKTLLACAVAGEAKVPFYSIFYRCHARWMESLRKWAEHEIQGS